MYAPSKLLTVFAQPVTTPLFLAPQAGVSEAPFRRLCRSFGADVVETEFVSAEGVLRGSPATHDYLRFEDDERPIGIQIFGAEAARMADAAAFVAEVYGPDFIDLNFGCPVKKVVKRNGGSGCLRDLPLVQRIVRAVDDAVALPVTVKIRSGFDEQSRTPVAIARACREAGASMVTLHPRTRADMYSGRARWNEIAAVVEALDIPVVGNGDIRTGPDACRMRNETGCAGVMIARGSHGNPWIFSAARAALEGAAAPPQPSVDERLRVCLQHARHAIEFQGDDRRGVLEFRKHLGWYTKGLPDGRSLRTELHRASTLSEIEERLTSYRRGQRGSRAAA